jgi:hypothetical protein
MAEMASSSMNAATLAHVRTPPCDHATNRHTLSSMLLHFTEHAGIVIDAPSSFPRTRKNVKTDASAGPSQPYRFALIHQSFQLHMQPKL